MRAASPRGRAVARQARNSFEARGVQAVTLRRCSADIEPPLPGCVKTCLGPPAAPGLPGKFGMVFAATVNPDVLLCLAFGGATHACTRVQAHGLSARTQE